MSAVCGWWRASPAAAVAKSSVSTPTPAAPPAAYDAAVSARGVKPAPHRQLRQLQGRADAESEPVLDAFSASIRVVSVEAGRGAKAAAPVSP